MTTKENTAWELAAWDAVETTERLKKKEVSATEVIEAAIIRARSAGSLGAIVTPTFERAWSAAQTATGPLAGVPTFIKDLAQVAGVRTAWGSAGSGQYVSRESDPAVKLLEGTGMISLGKSATPEFGLTGTTEPLAFSPCLNPWDVAHSSGGSSGGAATLVAAGIVPIAHGSDGGGSIRIPASCCGLVGLKVTRGRFDMEASPLLPVNVAVHGALTRSVRDTVAFWEAIEQQLTSRRLPPIGALSSQPRKRLRIAAYVDTPLGTPVHPDARLATEQAMKRCEELGHEVQLVPCPIERQVIEDFLRLWGFIAFVQAKGGRLLVHRDFETAKLEPMTTEFARYFSDAMRASMNAMRRLRGFTQTWAKLMERFDVVMSPSLAEPPAPLGHLATHHRFEVLFERLTTYTPFTAAINAAGAPALSLPLGRSARGLPMGVQFAAAQGQERLLLDLGRALEEAAPWEKVAPRTSWHRS